MSGWRGGILAALVTGVAALVCAAGPAAAAKGGKTAGVTIKGMRFTPATVEIRVGEGVTWTNADDRDHTVSAADGSFASGNIGPGGTFTAKFAKAGTYAYGCGLHPRMRGVVVVQ